ncbi:unnamed protein product, partial [Amoebophrya sp. A25]|eukprot:GSA25T00007953001.1
MVDAFDDDRMMFGGPRRGDYADHLLMDGLEDTLDDRQGAGRAQEDVTVTLILNSQDHDA